MRIALITIATGEAYQRYAIDLMESAKTFMPKHDQFVFTDLYKGWASIRFHGESDSPTFFYTEPKGYPRETLMRYHTILSKKDLFLKYDQIFYVDADMEFVAPVGNIFSTTGLVATLHPGFIGRHGTPETRFVSTAFCATNTRYFAGGFQGGDAGRYILAMEKMARDISEDDQRGIMATWHDESHWNKYLAVTITPELVLGPSYCYPEDYSGQWGWSPADYPPILVALDKRKRGNHPRFQ